MDKRLQFPTNCASQEEWNQCTQNCSGSSCVKCVGSSSSCGQMITNSGIGCVPKGCKNICCQPPQTQPPTTTQPTTNEPVTNEPVNQSTNNQNNLIKVYQNNYKTVTIIAFILLFILLLFLFINKN